MRMSKQEFMEVIRQEMEKKTGCEVLLREITKQNGIHWNGLMVRKEESPIAPIVYLNDFYEAYQNGRSLKNILETVYSLSENQKSFCKVEQVLSNYEKAKQKIGYKLLNREKNKEYFREMVHASFLDLEKVYYVLIEEEEGYRATMLIQKKQLEIWGISEEQLKQQAEKNMKRLFPVRLKPILEAIQEVVRTNGTGELGIRLEENVENEMYVLSNSMNHYGASVVAYEGLLEEIGRNWNCDFVILPSSVHEVILCPIREEVNLCDLVEMVKEINETEVREEEVLSDHVYWYERARGKVKVI